jgi:hypothetical protein
MSTMVKVGKIQAQVARYILSSNDFEEALSYLYARPPEDNVVIRRALLTAAIIAYARPFTNNEKGSSAEATATVSLKLNNILSKDELAQHKDLIEMRNLAIAHSTSELRPVVYNPLDPPTYLVGHHVFDPLTQAIDHTLFASACKKLRSACFASMSELNTQIRKATSA